MTRRKLGGPVSHWKRLGPDKLQAMEEFQLYHSALPVVGDVGSSIVGQTLMRNSDEVWYKKDSKAIYAMWTAPIAIFHLTSVTASLRNHACRL